METLVVLIPLAYGIAIDLCFMTLGIIAYKAAVRSWKKRKPLDAEIIE